MERRFGTVIETGAFGFPMDGAAAVAVGTVAEEGDVEQIRFVLYEHALAVHARALESLPD